ncbi:MAG: hypothetical protein Q9209_004483 [Squamulea sp. 1 TL-2023]
MASAPPAWLRSYKAHSAIIPNYASQVRTEIDNKPPTNQFPEQNLSEKEINEKTKHTDVDDTTTPNPITFPSTISLTLHNVVSLDKSYSNSTPESSPKKASFNPPLEQHPALRPRIHEPPHERRRGPGNLFEKAA